MSEVELLEKGVIGIYKITSPIGKVYIGQSKCIKTRWKYHRYSYSSSAPGLLKSVNEFGIEKHVFEVLEECEKFSLNSRERYWQEYYDVLNPEKGLNYSLVETVDKKREVSEVTKKTISENHWNLGGKSEDNPYFGRKHSEEVRNKMKGPRPCITGESHPKAKVFLDLETGIYYSTIGEVADALNINYSTLRHYLNPNSNVKNKTSIIRCN